MPPLPTGHNDQIRSAPSTLDEAGQKMAARCRTVQQTVVASIELVHSGLSSLNGLPEFIAYDSQVGTLADSPLASWPRPGYAFVGSWNLYEA